MAGSKKTCFAVWIGAILASFLLVSAPTYAQKIVLFKNGKVMRVESVETKNGWMKFGLGKDNILGVRATEVLKVEDVGQKEAKADSMPNQASVGGGGGAGGGAGMAEEPEASGYSPQRVERTEAAAAQEGAEEIRQNMRNSRALNRARNLRNLNQNSPFTRSRFGAQPPRVTNPLSASGRPRTATPNNSSTTSQDQSNGDD